MYEKDGCFLIGSSASALDHNLSILKDKNGEYKSSVVHKSAVNLITWNVDDGHQHRYQVQCKSANGINKASVIQAKWCRFHTDIMLVVITTDAIQVYNRDGEEICCWTHDQLNDGSHVRGMAVLPDHRLAVGIAAWNDTVIAAYGSGHIRLFNVKHGQILAEITAHARWITGLDLASSVGLVLSTSEDSFVRVWQLHPSQESPIALKFSECIPDVRLCGGCFMEPVGNRFALVGYEQEDIMCYSM